jgi:hypothetical protein
MARLGRYFIEDQPLHVIQRGNNRQAIFFADEDCPNFAASEPKSGDRIPMQQLELLATAGEYVSCRRNLFSIAHSATPSSSPGSSASSDAPLPGAHPDETEDHGRRDRTPDLAPKDAGGK